MNEDEVRVMLAEEIKKEFEELKNIEPGSEEQGRAIANLERLYKLRIEEIRCDTDFDEKWNRRELDRSSMEERKFDKIVKIGLDVLAIIAPITFNWVWMNRGLEFEKEGTYTSATFRNLFNKFRPTK